MAHTSRSRMVPVTTRNARFQQWQALVANRTKRQRLGKFVVQGVRPLTLAVASGWPIVELLVASDQRLSSWASKIVATTTAERFALPGDLLAEIADKAVPGTSTSDVATSGAPAPELVAVVELPADDLQRLRTAAGFLGVLCDRPSSPGNLGAIIRSADAFEADGVIVSGHADDVYDPQVVRASTGSLFAMPTVRVPGPRDVAAWRDTVRAAGVPLQLVGTDEDGEVSIAEADLTGPTLLLIGNETTGLSTAWRDLADLSVRIPIGGSASSLNAANAATVLLYEAARQRALA